MSSLVVLLLSALALATLTPTAPGPGDSFSAGSSCTIKWNPDVAGGQWTDISIYLMAGPNNNMTQLTTVVSGLDGTDESLSPYSWTCPEVDPYSAIYFYQFTNGDDIQNSQWTTRFTITSASGDSEKPEHDTQPNGDPVPWGEGHLVSGVSDVPAHQQALSGVGSQRDRGDDDPDGGDGNGTDDDDPEGGTDGTSADDSQSVIHQHEDDESSDELRSSSDPPSSDLASTSSRHATGSPTGSRGGISGVLMPTVGSPDKARPAHTQAAASFSVSAPNSSVSCSQMGPGISNADNAVKLASAGRARQDRRWQGAASLYWFLAAMLL